VQLDGETKPIQSLVSSAIALVPKDCGCGPSLSRLEGQAIAGGASVVYFVGTGAPSVQLIEEANTYGRGHALPAEDADGVLARTFHPTGLTVLLVFNDATAEVQKNLSGNFQLGLTPFELHSPGANAYARANAEPSAKANPTAGHSAG
jgi:hypothetical protein